MAVRFEIKLKEFSPMHGYIAVVLRRRDAGFRVEFPDLPGCRCAASNVEAALARAVRALGTYMAALERDGLVPPAPRPAPEMLVEADRRGAAAAACLVAPPHTARPSHAVPKAVRPGDGETLVHLSAGATTLRQQIRRALRGSR